MKILKLVLVVILLSNNLIACKKQHKKKENNSKEEIFKVVKTSQKIMVDGKMDEFVWKEAKVGSLDYFLDDIKPTDKQKSTFRMLWDEENLYLFYECDDPYLTAREINRDGTPYLDDCVEIFLIPVPEPIQMHYGFEVNLYKTSNDFIYLNNMYKGEFISGKGFNPEFDVAFTIDGTVNDNTDVDTGYTMEMAIPIKVFKGADKFFPVEKGNQWRFLALRQNRNDIDGDRRTASTMFLTEGDVHDPNVFGLLEFVE